ncbi:MULTISPECIES: YgfZ/GcvT domain-containing protein [Thiomicrorhabdus]|uniref:Folate-binding protein YgfZ n=1 Tax=Thiomicrorhabdus heinhorstiae TaxID=2748010 RepID=A0ABS0BY33_9GAMM|nr:MULTISPECIES: folate-binding protein YgfZ [Thiomicrorhabdus]MBF6057914.1 folate-binding protein YgfZ [Thiomicrorhabdus heinhorstiae]
MQSTLDSTWLNFLQSFNAQFDDTGRITSFGHPELERFLIKNGPVMTSLTHQALLKVSGNDAFNFLQGQLTADLKDVSAEKAQFSAYCDPQGNVLANFLVFQYKGDFYLSFDGSLLEAIKKRLSMFVLRSDVAIEDVSGQLIHVGFAGEFGDVDMQRRMNTKIKNLFEAAMVDDEIMQDILAVKVPGPYHRYELFGPAEQMIEAWNQIRANCDLTNSFDWKLLNIAAGIPEVSSETSGKFTAQFLNLDKFDAISFKKGCFPGQEIIARIHYRGKVTKRMLRLHIEEDMPLSAGDELKLQDDNGKTHTLNIMQVRPDIFSGILCLAVGTLKSLGAAEGEHLKTENGNPARIEPLPYSITDED